MPGKMCYWLTHRNCRYRIFKDRPLFVIDEEQRFGVQHKEKNQRN